MDYLHLPEDRDDLPDTQQQRYNNSPKQVEDTDIKYKNDDLEDDEKDSSATLVQLIKQIKMI